jgi:hypothetical protein
MAVRTLEQILGELGSVYDPQVASLRQQQSLVPEMQANEEKGLEAKQTQAFGDILNGARQRGLGFSGIPLAEQAKYTSTDFLPAIARLRSESKQRSSSLEDAILGINERRTTNALGLRQQDVDNDYRERQLAEQQRQFNEQLDASRRAAAGANSFAPSFGGGSSSAPAAAKMQSRGGGQFNFQTASGQPISAVKYAQLMGADPIQFLYQLGQQGDKTSAQAWYALSKVTNPAAQANVKKQYSSLFWGT